MDDSIADALLNQPNLLFDGKNKVYVGIDHGKKVRLSDRNLATVRGIAKKHGAWFEGDGSDAGMLDIPRSDYRGSWDEMLEKQVIGYPPEFLYTLFTNVEENQQARFLTKPRETIMDAIVGAQDKVGYLKNKKFTKEAVTQFLKLASESNADLLAMASEPATSENVAKFLSKGESLMWPDNWQKYPNNAGKVAKKANDRRMEFLKDQLRGVYAVGSDHLKALKAMEA